MNKHRVFVSVLGAFAAGVIIGSVLPFEWAMVALGAASVSVLFMALAQPRFVYVLGVAVVVCGMCVGLWRTHASIVWAQAERVLDGATVEITGVVHGDLMRSAFERRVLLGVRGCSDEVCARERRMLVRMDGYEPQISMRDAVTVTCTLAPIENFDPGFDYAMYMAAKGVRYECRAEDVSVYDGVLDGVWWCRSLDQGYLWLAQVRGKLERRLVQIVPQPQAALAAGLLFGGDERLSEYWQEQFRVTGLTHIVAVSGYNVTIIVHALILGGILIGLWRRQSVWAAIGGVALFVLMIGAPSAAVRAGVMGVTVLLLMYGGRMSAALPALLFAAGIMLWDNPLLARYDVGFQLSFLATLGIIVVYPLFEQMMGRSQSPIGLREIIFVTMSAQVFVVPVIAWHFGTFATMSLVANILVLPIVPIAMALACVMLLVSFVSIVAASWCGWLVAIVLSWVFWVTEFFAAAPYAQLETTRIGVWWYVAWYSVVFGILLVLRRRSVWRCTHKK